MKKKLLPISVFIGLSYCSPLLIAENLIANNKIAQQAITENDCSLTQACANNYYLEEVVVTGTRTEKSLLYSPNATSLVSTEQMKTNVSDSLAVVLRDIPGLNVTDAGQAGMKRVRIRGESSYRVAILVDGQEITDHRGEGVPLTLDPSVVERIEVVRGAGSVLYGPKALGGVINFITIKGGDKPLQLTSSVGWNSATAGEQYFISGYGSQQGFDYRLSYSKTDNNDRQTPKGKIENTSSNNDSLNFYLAKRWQAHELAVSWDNHHAYSDVFVEDEVRFAPPFNEFTAAIPQRDRSKLGLFYTWENPSEWLQRFHVDAYRQTSDRQFNTYWSQITGTEKTTMAESELLTTGALAQLDLQLGNHYLISGVQYTNDEVQQDRVEQLNQRLPFPININSSVYDEASLQTKALFLQDEWQLSDNLAVTTGLRQYWVNSELEQTSRTGLVTPSRDDSELITAIAATWEISEGSVLRVGFFEGYIYPSLLQLAIGAVARTFVNPDATLDPEKSKTYELGWRYNSNNWQTDITLFRADAKNYIDNVSCTPSPSCIGGTSRAPAEIYVNVGEANTTGIEAQLQYLFSDQLTSYTSLTWMKRKHQYQTFSTYKSGLPAFSGTAGIKYNNKLDTLGNYWLDIYARGETNAEEVEQDGSEHHNAGWVTANAVIGLAFGENNVYQLVAEFNNLFDNSYSSATENLWAAQRNVQAKLTINF